MFWGAPFFAAFTDLARAGAPLSPQVPLPPGLSAAWERYWNPRRAVNVFPYWICAR